MYSSPACKLCVIAPDIPPIVAFAHHLPDAKGALIEFVAKGSVGEAAGLLPEDIVVSVAGSPVVRPADVKSALAGVHAGTVVPVEIVRGDQRMTVNVKF